MSNREKYGICDRCDVPLVPVFFTEEEYNHIGGSRIRTGRKRRAVSHLICPICLQEMIVDDSFDGPWE